jgi:carbonic anhydrase/acetyltransferase-like protein (isoleucine patch superfamily)
LMAQETIKQAVVIVTKDTLVAYVVLESEGDWDKQVTKTILASILPSYMVPNIFVILKTMPTTSSGKIDRKLLPPPVYEKTGLSLQEQLQHATVTEVKMLHIWQDVLTDCTFGLSDDFFEVGGHSLMAVVAVNKMRVTLCPHLGTLDLLEWRTIETLSAQVDILNTQRKPEQFHTFVPSGTPLPLFVCSVIQLIGIIVLFGLWSASLVPVIIASTWLHQSTGRLWVVGACSPVLITLNFGVFMFLVACCKWVILGRTRPGAYNMWSVYFIRWWFVQRMLAIVHYFVADYMRETIFLNIWYRLLGAKIGRNVLINTTLLRDPDMITIGDYSIIDDEAVIKTNRIMDFCLILQPICIGTYNHIGCRAMLMPNSTTCDDVHVVSMSTVGYGTIVPEGTRWQGIPGKATTLVGVDHQTALYAKTRAFTHWTVICGHWVGLHFLFALYVTVFFPSWLIVSLVSPRYGNIISMAVATSMGPALAGIVLMILIVTMKWVLIGKLHPGQVKFTRWGILRHWFLNRILSSPILRNMFLQLFGNTIIEQYFLRLLGISIGHSSYVSSPSIRSDMDLITIGDNVWIGSNVHMSGGSRFDQTSMICSTITIQNSSVIAENCVLEAGANIPEYATVGSGSLLQGPILQKRSTWLGNPLRMFQKEADHGVYMHNRERRSVQLQNLKFEGNT